jgi:putative serine dehydratase-like protein
MDAGYWKNRDRDGEPTKAFEPSLFVWATVMSRPAEDRAIVDAGLKALAFDSGPPLVCDEPAATYERASDEHGRLAVSAATNRLGLGDKIGLIPGHCDPTVNLYDWYVCVRNNRVEQLWPITAPGCRLLTLGKALPDQQATSALRSAFDHTHPSAIILRGEMGAVVMSSRSSPAAGRTRTALDAADFGTEAEGST